MNIWTRLKLITAPNEFGVVTLEQAKAHLRVSHADDDAVITAMIGRAVAQFDGPRGIGLCLSTQTWELRLDAFPLCIDIPLGPVASVLSVKYIDMAGVEQTLAALNYKLDTGGEMARLVPAFGLSWPAPRSEIGAVAVQFVAGSASVDINKALIGGVLLLVGHYYENREAVSDAQLAALPLAVAEIMEQFRVGRVA